MRTVLRTAGGLAAAVVITLTAAPPAGAQTTTNQPPPNPVIFLKPDTGPAGSGFTIGWSGFTPACRRIFFTWDGAALTQVTAPPPSGSVGATVPANAPSGKHTVGASVDIGNCEGYRATAVFTVPGTPTTPVPPVTDPPITNPPVTIPPVTKPPVTNPPGSNPPGTRPPGVTTTTPPSTPPTTTTGPTTPGSSTSDSTTEPPPAGDLVLDHPSIQPGDPLSAAGKGCTPGGPVTLMSGGERVGGAVVAADGTFSAPVQFTRIEAGRHKVTASCGIVLTGAVDQVVTSSTAGHSSTLIVLVFFVLIGVAVLRFN
jgi:hypothetical protein